MILEIVGGEVCGAVGWGWASLSLMGLRVVKDGAVVDCVVVRRCRG